MWKNPFLYVTLALAGGLIWMYMSTQKTIKAKQDEIDKLKKG